MIAEVGKRNLPAAEEMGKTKYPLNFVSIRTLYSVGQVGGVRSYLKSTWSCQNVIQVLAGNENLKETKNSAKIVNFS